MAIFHNFIQINYEMYVIIYMLVRNVVALLQWNQREDTANATAVRHNWTATKQLLQGWTGDSGCHFCLHWQCMVIESTINCVLYVKFCPLFKEMELWPQKCHSKCNRCGLCSHWRFDSWPARTTAEGHVGWSQGICNTLPRHHYKIQDSNYKVIFT